MRNSEKSSEPAPGVIDRAAQLLGLVVRAEQGPTFTQLVDETGMTRATVSRTMAALVRNDLVERTEAGSFRGGPLFVEYAARFDRTEALMAQAGWIDRAINGESAPSVVHAVRADQHLTKDQKAALLAVYRSYIDANRVGDA